MADRTWVRLYVPSRYATAVDLLGVAPDQTSETDEVGPGVTCLAFDEIVADEDRFDPSLPWLMHFGSCPGQWSCGATVNTGEPANLRVTVTTSETTTLPHVPVKPNGRPEPNELRNVRRFFKALRLIRERHGVRLPDNP